MPARLTTHERTTVTIVYDGLAITCALGTLPYGVYGGY